MIRVFINALCAGNQSGTGRYAAELCRALSEIESDGRFICAVEETFPYLENLQRAPNFELLVQPVRKPLARSLWEMTRLPALVRKSRADVFHGPAFIAPPRLPCPSVVTIHDCAFLRYGHTIPPLRRAWYRRAFFRSAREAARIAADSQSTRRDVIYLMGMPDEKVSAIPLAVGREFFVETVSPEEERRVREAIGAPGPFILTYGSIEPRKNLPALIRAYARWAQSDSAAPPLVVAGRYGWSSRELPALAREHGVEERVLFCGRIEESDLPIAISLATAFVCVSIYEGFGLPPLEAMAAGAPVIASKTSSLPEVVGEAGTLVDPMDEEKIAEALRRLCADESERRRLSEWGRRRAARFDWRTTARQTDALYRQATLTGRARK